MFEGKRIGVIGLGYVGLPLAVAFGQARATTGFDIDAARIAELQGGHDRTLETTQADLSAAENLIYSSDLEDMRDCGVYIVTVPTPIDEAKRPDLSPLVAASRSVGKVLSKGDVVIFESTVFPGATEEVCAPILEEVSNLELNKDFFLGYSPERINPGDKTHRLADICKVTSGSTPEIARQVDALYAAIVTAGTHMAPSIKVAEAAKVIENTQRDLNIALINELAIIFDRLDIDTEAVLAAAGTKWNFLPFRPGLVGGHCIGVDPYYLTHKAEAVGYHPEVILAGRRINDGMGAFVAGRLVKEMIARRVHPNGAKVLLMGITFKENCPDLRNTRVVDLVKELREFGIEVDVTDPWADTDEAHEELGIDLCPLPDAPLYDAVILAVAHDEFRQMGAQKIRALGHADALIYDLKYILPPEDADMRL